MISESQVRGIVNRALDRVNELSLDQNSIRKDDSTILLGDGGVLDSMGFVNLVVALEEELAACSSSRMNLAERLSSARESGAGLRTVGDLIQLIADEHASDHGHAAGLGTARGGS